MSGSSVSRFATHLLNLLITTKDRSFADVARWSVLLRARRIVVRLGDPLVEYDFCGTRLRMPLSHSLPVTLRTFPLYSDNLGRIAARLFSKYPDLKVIDIGANIGDSVAIIHRHAKVPILCIEGEPKFSELLRSNIRTMSPAPVIERSFVGAGGEALAPVVHDGTASLAAAASAGSGVGVKSIERILEEHSEFQHSRLLKIDTDGMDVLILNSALGWISREKPVLFFEYDPDFQAAHGAGGLELLAKLNTVGYHRVLIYEGNGDYMFSTELENKSLLSDLHEYFSGKEKYGDLCVFHREDDDIAEILRRSELDVFRAARQFSPGPAAELEPQTSGK